MTAVGGLMLFGGGMRVEDPDIIVGSLESSTPYYTHHARCRVLHRPGCWKYITQYGSTALPWVVHTRIH